VYIDHSIFVACKFFLDFLGQNFLIGLTPGKKGQVKEVASSSSEEFLEKGRECKKFQRGFDWTF